MLRQQPKAVGVALQQVGGVALGVAEQLDVQRAAGLQVEGDLQVAHRPRGQFVGDARHPGEIQGEIEQLEVDDRPGQGLGIARPAEIAGDLLGVVALVTTYLLELGGQHRGQLRQRLAVGRAHAQGQDVERRPTRLERYRAHAPHEDETGAEGRLSAEAGEPGGGQGHRQIGRRHPLGLAMLGQPGEYLGRYPGTGFHHPRRGHLPGQPPGRQGRGRRQRSPPLAPEGFVALADGRMLIVLVFTHHLGKGDEGRGLGRLTAHRGAVQGGHPLGQGGEAIAIDQQVVIALVPEQVIVTQLVNPIEPQRTAAGSPQVAVEIGANGCPRGTFRIGCPAQVQPLGYGDGSVGIYPLHQLALAFSEVEPQAVQLAQALDDGRHQRLGLERPAQFDQMGHGEGIGMGRQLIGQPDAGLGGDQGQFGKGARGRRGHRNSSQESREAAGRISRQWLASQSSQAARSAGPNTGSQPEGTVMASGQRLHWPRALRRISSTCAGSSKGLRASIGPPGSRD